MNKRTADYDLNKRCVIEAVKSNQKKNLRICNDRV